MSYMAGNTKRCYHFLSAYWAIDDLQKKHVKISLFDKVNDERELQAYFVVGTGLSSEAFTQWFSERFTMLCFGIDSDDEHLWTEYGDAHRGICFGFDIGTDIVKEVKYVAKKREVELPRELINGIRKRPSKPGEAPTPLEKRAMVFVEPIFLTKFDRWEREKEWRAILRKDEEEDGRYYASLIGNPRFRLCEVILGANCAESEDRIRELVRDYPNPPTEVRRYQRKI